MKEEKVVCPACGAEFATPENGIATVATVVAKNSGQGVLYPVVVGQQSPAKLPKSAQERIEALRRAGMDVSRLVALREPDGSEHVASKKDGKFIVLADDDPIYQSIAEQGTVPNRRLFRRWVMAQMFHMLSHTDYRSKKPVGVTEMIHRLGYEYQWKMLLGELYAQMKMERKDPVNFVERNRWFNADVVTAMALDYIARLEKHVNDLPVKKCKGIPYKRTGGRDIFVTDLQAKLYRPLTLAFRRIEQAKNATQLYNLAKKFNDLRIKMAHDTPQSKAWVDAYKGSGAFFTMQNLIRFHGCMVMDDAGDYLDKSQSLAFLTAQAEEYSSGEGWRLLAMLKKMLDDNGIDVKKKMAEWHKKK